MESSGDVEVGAPSPSIDPVDPRDSWSLLDLNKELDILQRSLEKASRRRPPPKEKPFTSLFSEPQYSGLRQRLASSTALPDDESSAAHASPSMGESGGLPEHLSSEGMGDRRGSGARQKLFVPGARQKLFVPGARQKLFVPGAHRGRAEVATSFSPGWAPASRLDSSPGISPAAPGAPVLDDSWDTPERLKEAAASAGSEARAHAQERAGEHGFGSPREAPGQSAFGTPGEGQQQTRGSWKKSSLAAGAFLTARKSRSRGFGAVREDSEARRSAPPRVDTQGNAYGTPLTLGHPATPQHPSQVVSAQRGRFSAAGGLRSSQGEAMGRGVVGYTPGTPDASKGRALQGPASVQAAREEAAAAAGARVQAQEAAKVEARLQVLEASRQLAVGEAVRQGRESLQLGLLREEVALLEQEEELEDALGTVHRRLAEGDERQAEAMRALRDAYAETLRAVQEQGGGLGTLQEEQEMMRRRQRAEEEAEAQRAQALARQRAQEEAEAREREREREQEREQEREKERERERERERLAQAQRAEQHKAALDAQAHALKEQQHKERALHEQQAAEKEAALKAQQGKAQPQGASPAPTPAPASAPPSLPEWGVVKLREGVELRARGSLRALEQAHAREGQRKEWEAQVAAYRGDPGRKRERKDVERALVKLVQQISATQQQVAAKSQEITAFFQSSGNIPTPFLLLTLSEKVMSQTEACKMPMVAFALAQVLVNVSASVAGVMEAMLGALGRECPYTVPREWSLRARGAVGEQDREEHLRYTGYKSEGGKLEPTDLFVERIVGCVTLLGAMLQATPAGRGGGGGFGGGGFGGGFGGGGFGGGAGGEQAPRLGMAWQWCAALLNDLPPSRSSATALESFLKVAGYGLNRKYARPFQKLLQAVYRQYIPALRELQDPDVSPVVTRLATYVEGSLFLKPPEGLNLPRSDISSNLRA